MMDELWRAIGGVDVRIRIVDTDADGRVEFRVKTRYRTGSGVALAVVSFVDEQELT